MANTIHFELVSPQEIVRTEAVEMVLVPGAEGDLGVLPQHSPLISVLRPGIIKLYENGNITDQMFIDGGFCEISPSHCVVLAEEVLTQDNINSSEAETRIANGKNALEEAIAHAENFREVNEVKRRLAVANELLAAAKAIEKKN